MRKPRLRRHRRSLSLLSAAWGVRGYFIDLSRRFLISIAALVAVFLVLQALRLVDRRQERLERARAVFLLGHAASVVEFFCSAIHLSAEVVDDFEEYLGQVDLDVVADEVTVQAVAISNARQPQVFDAREVLVHYVRVLVCLLLTGYEALLGLHGVRLYQRRTWRRRTRHW